MALLLGEEESFFRVEKKEKKIFGGRGKRGRKLEET